MAVVGSPTAVEGSDVWLSDDDEHGGLPLCGSEKTWHRGRASDMNGDEKRKEEAWVLELTRGNCCPPARWWWGAAMVVGAAQAIEGRCGGGSPLCGLARAEGDKVGDERR